MTRCSDLDALLGDRQADEDTPLAHAETCDTCADALLDDASWDDGPLADALRGMRETTCPPAVLQAVRRATTPASSRRAPDRAAPRTVRRWVLPTAVAAALLLALAVRLADRPDPMRPSAPVADRVTETPQAPPAVVPEPETPAPSQDAGLPSPTPGTVRPVAPAVPRQPARREPRSAAPPAPQTPPLPDVAPDARPEMDLAMGTEPALPDSVAAARDDLQLAFAIVGRTQRLAGGAVVGEVDRLSDTLRRTTIF